jgi:hypothetical protein
MVNVSDIGWFSLLDVDDVGGTVRNRAANVFGLICRRILIEEDDDPVLVALVEHCARV